MNTHIFIVNEQTFKIHLEHMFAGIGAKTKTSPFLCNASENDFNAIAERNLVSMIADISRIQIGDNIIFYLQSSKGKQGQFFGIFKAKSTAFFDENDADNYLKKELGKGLSYRILIGTSEYGVYSKGITEHEYLDSLEDKNHPYELCWSLIYRKLKGNRGCTMITNLEFKDLLNKLQKRNEKLSTSKCYTYDSINNKIIPSHENQTYSGRQNPISITDRLLYKINNKKAFESHLQAFILQNIKSLNLLKLPNQDFWIGNEVSCGIGMQRIDILIIQEDSQKAYFKVIELKDEVPKPQIVDIQLDWYIKWLFDYIIPNYNKEIEITPCIIAAKTSDEKIITHIKEYIFKNRNSHTTIHSTEYLAFNISNGEIQFEKIT